MLPIHNSYLGLPGIFYNLKFDFRQPVVSIVYPVVELFVRVVEIERFTAIQSVGLQQRKFGVNY